MSKKTYLAVKNKLYIQDLTQDVPADQPPFFNNLLNLRPIPDEDLIPESPVWKHLFEHFMKAGDNSPRVFEHFLTAHLKRGPVFEHFLGANLQNRPVFEHLFAKQPDRKIVFEHFLSSDRPKMVAFEHFMAGHSPAKSKDRHPPTDEHFTFHLKSPHVVSKVTVSRSADGTLNLTLEE